MPKSLGEDGEGATNASRMGKELFRKIEGVIGGLLQKAGVWTQAQACWRLGAVVAGEGDAEVVETGQTGSQALVLSLGDCQGPIRAPRAPSPWSWRLRWLDPS